MSGFRGRFITDQRITRILTEWTEVLAEVSGAECQITVPKALRAAQCSGLCCISPLASIGCRHLVTRLFQTRGKGHPSEHTFSDPTLKRVVSLLCVCFVVVACLFVCLVFFLSLFLFLVVGGDIFYITEASPSHF